jgi:hypothetical protein
MTDSDVGGEDIDAVDQLPTDPAPIALSRSPWGAPTPIFRPSKSTPLEEDEEDVQIPHAALWAMKYRRHFHFGSRDNDVFRARLGTEGDRVYVLDDGDEHYMICREVGVDEVLEYFLVGRIPIETYERRREGEVGVVNIFSEAKDLGLCSVYDASEAASNIVLVENYGHIDDVPSDYLPCHPLIQFTDELLDES